MSEIGKGAPARCSLPESWENTATKAGIEKIKDDLQKNIDTEQSRAEGKETELNNKFNDYTPTSQIPAVKVDNAGHADNADNAVNAVNATNATEAVHAADANNAVNATNDANGDNISTTYAKQKNTYTKEEVDNKISSVYKYKGSVALVDDLPKIGNIVGDVYDVRDSGINYAWDGKMWDSLGMNIDLADYAKKTDVPGIMVDTANYAVTAGTANKVVAGATDTKDNHLAISEIFLDSITLDFTLDGTALTNVEFENVGNGIFLSKYILKRISMDNLLSGGTDVGTGTIGKNAEASIEAALKKQFGNSVSLRTYRRTYDGAAHAEKVFLPLESEVHGSGNMQWSADKKDIYPRWQIPNNNIKTEINNISNTWYWWCANKSSRSGAFCYVRSNGFPSGNGSYYDVSGVALAFKLY